MTRDPPYSAETRGIALPSGLVALALAGWHGAAGSVGDPARATVLLALAAAGAAAVWALARGRTAFFERTPAFARLAGATLGFAALLPLALAATVRLVSALPLPAFAALPLLVAGWVGALALAAPALTSSIHPRAGDRPAAAWLLAAGTALAGGGLLAAGLPPVLLSVAGAGFLWLGGRSADAPAGEGDALNAALGAAIGTAWLLAVPPLLASFAGPLPHGSIALVGCGCAGAAVGALAWPAARRARWAGPVFAGLAALAALVMLGRFPALLSLAASPDLRAVTPLLPWAVLALATAGPLGFAIPGWRLSDLWHRPGWAAAGAATAAALIAAAQGPGHVDLPIRLAAGLAVVGAMAQLVARPAAGRPLAAAAGWVAVGTLIAGVSLVRPLDPSPAALGLLVGAFRGESTSADALVGAELRTSGADRAGPHAVVDTPFGRHLFRGWTAREPGEADAAAEAMAALLPALAAGDPRHVTVVGLGRGGALRPLGALGLERLHLLDPSRHAAAQVSSVDGELRDLIAGPAVRIHRGHPMPLLPPSIRDQDVIVVDLPLPSIPGSRAWYGRAFAARVAGRVAPDGWAAFRVNTLALDPADLAATVVSFSRAFPGAGVWIDPSGNGDLILLGNPSGELPDAATMVRGLERRSLREAIRGQEVDDARDLFARAFGRADSPRYGARARASTGLSWRAARNWIRQEGALPLADLAGAASPVDAIVDLSGLPPELRSDLADPGMPADEFWPIYLRFLDMTSRGEAPDALAFADQIREGSDDPSRDLAPLVQQTVDAGRVAAAHGREDDAYALYLLAISFAPEDVSANVELGRLAWSRDNLGEAIQRFDTALDGEPDHLLALIGGADARIRLGRTDEAAALLERAVAAHPTSVEAMVNLGRLYSEGGRHDEAVTQLLRAQSFAPDEPRIPFFVAEARFLAAIEQREAGSVAAVTLDQARHAALHALSLERDARILCLYGQIELARGEFESAEAALEEALVTAPDDFDVRAGLGEAYFARQSFEPAARQFLAAEALRPGDERVARRLKQLRVLAPGAFPSPGPSDQ